MTSNHKLPRAHSTCRACGDSTITVFDMGLHYPNEFPLAGQGPSRPKVPLAWMRCHACGLVQLTHTTPAEWLFGVDPAYPYWYRSGIQEAMRFALNDVADSALETRPLYEGDTVVDIGANDGYLLSRLGGKGITRVAYEPAKNLHAGLKEHCEVLHDGFFPPRNGGRLPAASVRLAFSIAMFYDLENPGAFVSEIKRILAPDGVWVAQFAYLPAILRNGAFDGCCHEHLLYLGLIPFLRLLAAAELQVIDAYEVTVNEGSIRVFVTHKHSRVPTEAAAFSRVRALVAAEKSARLHDTNEPYLAFGQEAKKNRTAAFSLILKASLEGWKVDLLGASTKGNTWLQWCEFGQKHIRRAIERSPEKVGRSTVTGIPIVSEEEGRHNQADLLICPIWAFRDSVIAREKGRWRHGVRIAFPLPKMEIVEL